MKRPLIAVLVFTFFYTALSVFDRPKADPRTEIIPHKPITLVEPKPVDPQAKMREDIERKRQELNALIKQKSGTIQRMEHKPKESTWLKAEHQRIEPAPVQLLPLRESAQ